VCRRSIKTNISNITTNRTKEIQSKTHEQNMCMAAAHHEHKEEAAAVMSTLGADRALSPRKNPGTQSC
jgi:hypothetical protein